jgi:hypothetical protein
VLLTNSDTLGSKMFLVTVKAGTRLSRAGTFAEPVLCFKDSSERTRGIYVRKHHALSYTAGQS